MNKSVSFNFSSLIGLIILIIFGYFLFSIAKIVYIALLYASPIIAIAILFLNKELLFNFFKKIWNNIKVNPGLGIFNGLVSILFLPFNLVGMLIKALIGRKIDKMQKQHQENQSSAISSEYVEFEDLTSKDSETKISLENWDLNKWENRENKI